MKYVDLTGKRFGRWTVISKVENTKKGSRWNCVCDCGTCRDVSGSILLKGKSKSCGCIQKESKRENEDYPMIGMKFGELTVKKFEGYVKHNPRWICECSCGNEVSRSEKSLKSGKSVNCGGISHSKYVGKKFGRLTVLPEGLYGDKNHQRKYLCKCDCGNYVYLKISNLTSGTTRSCGCLHLEAIKKPRKHGMSRTRIHNVWMKILDRCKNKNIPEYKYYGGKGINICSEWREFRNFYDWALKNGYDENAPRGEYTIDRIDPNGDYCPENCRIVNMIVQANNKVNNVRIEYNGNTKTIAEWAREYNLPYTVLQQRYRKYGWDIDRALNTPVRKSKRREK